MEQNKKEILDELRSAIYNAEEDIDGWYVVGLFGDEFPQIDKIHSKILKTLREYYEILNNVVDGEKT